MPASATVAHSFATHPSSRPAPNSQITFPIPGTASSSLAIYKARLQAAFVGANARVCTAFWLFGLVNNVLYVVILSAALDLVGPDLPKATVLLADVVPSMITKLLAPYFVHLLPYRLRIVIIVGLAFVGMQLVAWGEALPARLFGVILASVSSGFGELSFLGMTHFYGQFAILFWGSGTGAAGLLGAGMYVCAISWIGLQVRSSLMMFGFLPVIMLVAFFAVLPQGSLKSAHHGYKSIVNNEDSAAMEEDVDEENANLMSSSIHSSSGNTFSIHQNHPVAFSSFVARLKRTSKLFFPYMFPLLIVYIAEYTINQGVAPTLLFPLSQMPFRQYRDAYPAYNAIYQTGVFISRSSTPFIRIRRLYPPSILQVINLSLLIAHAIYNFIPSIYIIFAIIFWEGLLGGAVYVNTFAEIMDATEGEEREFSLGATTVADSAGIGVAGFVSMMLEPWLCEYQVSNGRGYCKLT